MPLPSPDSLARAGSLDELYQLLAASRMGPGWNKPTPSLWPSPRKNFVPAHWAFARSRAALDAAGRFVSTELAERRNLILANPVEGNDYATVRTLVSAYQMVMPGETARSHRHRPNALRLVLDAGPNTFTVVDGVKIPMLPGDVLLTPNWAWHGHANESESNAYWIDFLDVPLMHFMEAMFFEHFPERMEQTEQVDAASPYRFAFTELCSQLDRQEAIDGWSVTELGPPRMDTIGLFMERLEAGAVRHAKRTTAHSIYAVAEGRGTSSIDGVEIAWERGDVIAIPGWRPAVHRATERSHLLRVTDEPLMKKLNWLREAE